MNTKMNKSQYDWYMMWFKRHVRSIVWDLENFSAIAADFNEDLTKAEREDLAVIIPRVKSYCIDLYNDYANGERDIRDYVKHLKIHFKVYFDIELLFLARPEPAISPDEEPSHYYNSLHVNFEDLHFSLQEEKYDDFLCEMAETHGMGYDTLDTWQFISVNKEV
jgi:hypothetical protein